MPLDSPSPYFRSLASRAASSYRSSPTEQPADSPAFQALLAGILERASSLLTAQERGSLVAGQVLSAGMRSVVVRVQVEDGTSWVVKYFRRRDSASNSGGFGYLREKQGLPALGLLAPGLYPSLLVADDTARLLILEDVTSGSASAISLGELLLSAGADAAPQRALEAWADTWAGVLSSPAQATAQEALRTALEEADPRAVSPGSLPSPQLAFKGLPLLAESRGLPLGSADLRQLEEAVKCIIYPEADQLVLSSGDFSPANILLTAGGLRGIDAEGACIHHWVLPLAELLLGFPSWPQGPLPAALLSGEAWQTACQEFYRRVAPAPEPSYRQDARVKAAVLTLEAILAEQRTKPR